MDIHTIIVQNTIIQKFNDDNGVTVHFEEIDYTAHGDGWNVVVRTYNPKTKQVFLLCEVSKTTLDDCYVEVLTYVDKMWVFFNNPKANEGDSKNRSWTVEWSFDGGDTQTSYFYGNSAKDVLKKFFFEKDQVEHKYDIFEIKQNPIS